MGPNNDRTHNILYPSSTSEYGTVDNLAAAQKRISSDWRSTTLSQIPNVEKQLSLFISSSDSSGPLTFSSFRQPDSLHYRYPIPSQENGNALVSLLELPCLWARSARGGRRWAGDKKKLAAEAVSIGDNDTRKISVNFQSQYRSPLPDTASQDAVAPYYYLVHCQRVVYCRGESPPQQGGRRSAPIKNANPAAPRGRRRTATGVILINISQFALRRRKEGAVCDALSGDRTPNNSSKEAQEFARNYSVLSRFDGPGCGSASDRVSELNTSGRTGEGRVSMLAVHHQKHSPPRSSRRGVRTKANPLSGPSPPPAWGSRKCHTSFGLSHFITSAGSDSESALTP
ncbi:hypothetical protein EVAR_19719_1 [Eumeta japonica]|uniref:Uncharacterized protein n=1 Tax=Eumeta variegata TaxID=151549 RepID=A0A4C1UQF4_EUMVA|nr:hypothetical protein EVAR_19719_1 [Eumeta japonica]